MRRVITSSRQCKDTPNEKDGQWCFARSTNNGAYVVVIIILVIILIWRGWWHEEGEDSAGCALQRMRVRLVSEDRARQCTITGEANRMIGEQKG